MNKKKGIISKHEQQYPNHKTERFMVDRITIKFFQLFFSCSSTKTLEVATPPFLKMVKLLLEDDQPLPN